MHIEDFLLDFYSKNIFIKTDSSSYGFFFFQMAYVYQLNNPVGGHLTVFDFTHLSPPPTQKNIFWHNNALLGQNTGLFGPKKVLFGPLNVLFYVPNKSFMISLGDLW